MGLENLVNVVFSLAHITVKFTNVYETTGNLKKAAWYSGLYDLLYRN
jgi:hypothetical protein